MGVYIDVHEHGGDDHHHEEEEEEEEKPESHLLNSSSSSEIMKLSISSSAGGGGAAKPCNSGGGGGLTLVGPGTIITMVLVALSILGVLLLNSVSPVRFPTISPVTTTAAEENAVNETTTETKLERVLRRASTEDKTVILATLNDAWIEPGSIFDLFLESFRIGNNTQKLTDHLVLITWDAKAYNRCLDVHPHCYQMEIAKAEGDFANDAFYMTPNYLHMMWRRTEFLSSVLQTGYSFVFTDLDIMWLRDPFVQFHKNIDFQIACDMFNGNAADTNNLPNGGFIYVRSNPRTIDFYKLWLDSRTVYPTLNEQDVLNKIKTHSFVSESNLTIRYLDTAYFGGFCQVSKDFNKVCTMHANCCVGIDNKINDLKILLDDWRKYMGLSPEEKQNSRPSWSVPQSCRTSFKRGNQRKSNGTKS